MPSRAHNLIDGVLSSKAIEILEAFERNDFSAVRCKYPKSTFYHSISKLKEKKMLERRKGRYCLTDMGKMYLKMLRKFLRCVEKFHEILENFPDHVIEFPEEFAMRLDEIGKFEVVVAESTDMFRPLKALKELLMQSEEIRAVSPIFYPDYPSLFRRVIEKVNSIELVVTKNVWKTIEFYSHIKDYSEKFRVYVVDEVPHFAVIVTDHFLSVNFYRKSGEYDFWRTLISREKSALKFGRDYFRFCKDKARKIL